MTSDTGQDPRLDALTAAVLAVHGDRLDEQQRMIVRQHVERLRVSASALDHVPLPNAVEPDFAFQAVQGVDGA